MTWEADGRVSTVKECLKCDVEEGIDGGYGQDSIQPHLSPLPSVSCLKPGPWSQSFPKKTLPAKTHSHEVAS